jgi:hypothetical protein
MLLPMLVSTALLLTRFAIAPPPPPAPWAPRALAAQRALAGCDGLIVHDIDIQPDRPPFSGAARKWQLAARAVGLHHATTRASVIRAFLAVHIGRPCTEQRRLESERILRAQSFIGEAQVTAVPDSIGGVTIRVRTTDEIPVLVGARFHGVGLPEAFSAGSANVGGSGMLVDANIERANGYRTGIGGRFVSATTFDRPYRFTLEGQRARLGHQFRVELEHPLYTDLQRIAWHGSYRSSDDFRSITRSARDPLALDVTQERWEGSGIVKVFGVRTISVVGAAVTRAHLVPADTGIVVTPEGFRPDTGTTLRNRYAPFLVTRAGAIAGVRRLQFKPVVGFDGLFATQDIASGFSIGVFGARGLSGFGVSDNFLSTATYFGAGNSSTLLAVATEVEGRRDDASKRWDSLLGSGRAALYLKSGPGLLFSVGDELSFGSRSRLPLQLSLGDWHGGMRGYGRAPLAGAERNVVRTEIRRSGQGAVRQADVGVALFGEVGTIWAGDAPYGVSTTRESVGVSFLAAYPTQSKRVYRLDIAMPLARDGVTRSIEFRVTSEDRTSRFWNEPDDVTRARTGAVQSSLFGWQKP